MSGRWYLGPWDWAPDKDAPGGGVWTLPPGITAGYDLRTAEQQGVNGVAGAAIFFAPEPLKSTTLVTLSDGPDERLSAEAKAGFETLWRTTLDSDRLYDLMHELRSTKAAAGGRRCLMPDSLGMIGIRFGGVSAQRPFVAGDSPEWPAVQARLQAHYRREREAVKAAQQDDAIYLKALDFRAKKLKCDYRLLVPSDLPDEGLVPHETTVSDNFPETAGTSLASTGRWEGEASLETKGSSDCGPVGAAAVRPMRYTTALSGDDLQVDADVLTGSGYNGSGLAARVNGATNTDYYGFYARYAGATRTLGYKRVSSGSHTNFVSDGTAVINSSPGRFVVNGSTFECWVTIAGPTLSKEIDTTDADVAGYKYAGVLFRQGSTAERVGTWSAQDLGGAPTDIAALRRRIEGY